MQLNQKIVLLRAAHSMTQTDLAKALSVTRQAVYKWESGQSYPEAMTLLAMRSLFGVSVDDLLDPAVDLTDEALAKPDSAAEQPAPQRRKKEYREAQAAPAKEKTDPSADGEEPQKPRAASLESPEKPDRAKEEPAAPENKEQEAAPKKKKGFFARLFR